MLYRQKLQHNFLPLYIGYTHFLEHGLLRSQGQLPDIEIIHEKSLALHNGDIYKFSPSAHQENQQGNILFLSQ